ncbi:hypothetical protein CsSME_00019477 [Camellia sinensis var. sinensis]
MEAARREKTIEHEIGGLQNDTLRFGLHSVKSEIVGSHPLQSAYQSTKEVQEQMKRRILVNTYGSTFPLKMDLDQQMLSRLNEFNIKRGVCYLKNLKGILNWKQKLLSLVIHDATLGNGIQEIPIYHDRLRQLQIVKCRVLRISVRCPQLEALSLKGNSMAHAVLNCPLLRDLDIASCHKFSDAAIRSAATSCPLLESLDMSNCSCVSDETLREIARPCGNLHVLNASYCPNISLETAHVDSSQASQLRGHYFCFHGSNIS